MSRPAVLDGGLSRLFLRLCTRKASAHVALSIALAEASQRTSAAFGSSTFLRFCARGRRCHSQSHSMYFKAAQRTSAAFGSSTFLRFCARERRRHSQSRRGNGAARTLACAPFLLIPRSRASAHKSHASVSRDIEARPACACRKLTSAPFLIISLVMTPGAEKNFSTSAQSSLAALHRGARLRSTPPDSYSRGP